MKIKIKPDCIITFLLLFCALNLSSYDYMGEFFGLLSSVLQVVSALGAMLMVLKKRGIRFTSLFWWIMAIEVTLVFSTFINSGDVRDCIVQVCSVIAFALIFEAWSQDLKSLIFVLMPLMELLCYANYLTILLFPNGMYSTYRDPRFWYSTANWLLGYRTKFIAYLLPACLVASLYGSYGGKRWREWGIYLVSFITIALSPARTATAMIGLAIFFVMVILIRHGVRFNVYFLAGVNIAAFFLIG